jgi:hypothetical protein
MNMEKQFPGLYSENLPSLKDATNDQLPALLKNEKDKKDFANKNKTAKDAGVLRQSNGTTAQALQNNDLIMASTMRTGDLKKLNFQSNDVRNMKQVNTYENGPKRITHNRTNPNRTSKIRKSAGLSKRSHNMNPNNLFLRNQTFAQPEYAKDPSNKFMKKPFLENLPSHQKNFYANKKGFISLFEDVTKINLVFSEVIETVLCYRPKLAQTLSNLNLSYNKLYERLLEQNHMSEMDKEKSIKVRITDCEEELQK